MHFDSGEHDFLPVPFTVLTLFGFWNLDNWSTTKIRIYRAYTALIILLSIILQIELVINIVLTKGTEEFNLEKVFVVNVFIIGTCKQLFILNDRKRILKLIHYCIRKDEWHQPQGSVEMALKRQTQDQAKKLSVLYCILNLIAITLRAVQPVIEAKTLIILPLDAWYPYSVQNFFTFSVTYFHQVICGTILACGHLTSDTVLVGLMFHINYQLKILALRFEKLGHVGKSPTKEQSKTFYDHGLQYTVAHNVDGHEKVYRFGNDVQRVFRKSSMAQMVVLIPNLILNVYFLSVYTDKFSLKYLMTFIFFVVPLMQICMFCWYGNSIILTCSDLSYALYKCDWINFDKSLRKLLLPIFMRSTQPIVISAGAVVPYNIDSFIKIMKTSYSAFNLLRQTTDG